MPLIRYVVGDRGRLEPSPLECGCGRILPLLQEVEGRTSELLVTRDGRRIFWLNPVFYGLRVREAQIVQETVDRIRVKFVPATRYGSADAEAMIERLHKRVGDMEIVLEATDHIPRGANGKFRAVISLVREATAPPHSSGEDVVNAPIS
jgi:phenylacetate-CoA ligase